MEFNHGLADFDSVIKFYWFLKNNRKHLFRDYQERVEFLHDFDEIMMNIQWSPEKKRVEFLKLQLFHRDTMHLLYEFFCILAHYILKK